jgi:hypothetical protein
LTRASIHEKMTLFAWFRFHAGKFSLQENSMSFLLYEVYDEDEDMVSE